MRGIPGAVVFFLRRVAEEAAARLSGKPTPPWGTDWVGYQALTRFMETHGVLAAAGDVVEIGTFVGGGAYKLSHWLERRAPQKRLIVIDIFEPGADLTPNEGGIAMASIYRAFMRVRGVASQWEAFNRLNGGRKNITVLKTDSRKARIPSRSLCFAFIDGNHDPDFVESDFTLVWERLSPGGAVAFHDYGDDLPQTRERIDRIVSRHAAEIAMTRADPVRTLFFIVRGQAMTGAGR